MADRGRFIERIEGMLDRAWLTNDGPLVREFEQRIAEESGVPHCVAMCNATVALEIAIRALGLTGQVIVPSYTFVATAHALQWQQITPVFCDIDPRTHNIDPDRVEQHITPRTSGIIGVHLWGRPCAIDRLEDIARQRGLRLLFDAAHAFGCRFMGRSIGGFGDAEVFSFHATKYLNSLEGGAAVTRDAGLAERMRLMRNFGFEGYDRVTHIGTNGKMTEACAAAGLTNLEACDGFRERNRRNHEAYRSGLRGLPGMSLIEYDVAERPNYQYAVVELDDGLYGLTRDELVTVLHAENVLARRYFWPGCHRMEPYRSYFPHAGLLLPETDRAAARVVVLPTGMAVGEEAIAQICRIIGAAHLRAQDVRRALRAAPGLRIGEDVGD